MRFTLPDDSKARKEYPMFDGLLRYFPAALAGVSKHSKEGNDKHNPGQELHHARGKSTDHENCIIRHLTDLSDMLVSIGRGDPQAASIEEVIEEANALAWRALALSQEIHEDFGAPLAPGARLPGVDEYPDLSDDNPAFSASISPTEKLLDENPDRITATEIRGAWDERAEQIMRRDHPALRLLVAELRCVSCGCKWFGGTHAPNCMMVKGLY